MELTQECFEEIVRAAKEAGNGRLTITIQPRPEDKRNFDMVCEFERRIRLSRDGRTSLPTETTARKIPADRYK